jgi:hypothetical protein
MKAMSLDNRILCLGLVILIIGFFIGKDYIEKFQETCDVNDPKIKGDRGDPGESGKNSIQSLSNEKKMLMDKFLKELRYENGDYYVNQQKIGCGFND